MNHPDNLTTFSPQHHISCPSATIIIWYPWPLAPMSTNVAPPSTCYYHHRGHDSIMYSSQFSFHHVSLRIHWFWINIKDSGPYTTTIATTPDQPLLPSAVVLQQSSEMRTYQCIELFWCQVWRVCTLTDHMVKAIIKRHLWYEKNHSTVHFELICRIQKMRQYKQVPFSWIVSSMKKRTFMSCYNPFYSLAA